MNWPELLGRLAEVYHWPPSELGALTLRDLTFWTDRLTETYKRWRGATPEGGTSRRR